jgi:hypothetical protein
MKRLLTALVLVLAHFLCSRPAYAQDSDVPDIDYILVVDVTRSMIGHGGTPDIFAEFKESIVSFIRRVDKGSRIFIAPFGTSVVDFRQFSIENDAGRATAINYVNALQATEWNTGVYDSMWDAFEKYQPFRKESSVALLIVYTDGKDNASKKSLNSVLSNFGLKKRDSDSCYYATLGVDLTESEVSTIEAYCTYGKFDEPQPLRVIRVLYPLLNFGNLYQPDSGREIAFRSEDEPPSDLRIILEGVFPALQQYGAYVSAQEIPFAPKQNIRITLVNPQSLPFGTYEGQLRLQPSDKSVVIVPSKVEVTFRYMPAGSCTPATSKLDIRLSEKANSYRASLATNCDDLARHGNGTFDVVLDPSIAGRVLINGSTVTGGIVRVRAADGDSLIIETSWTPGSRRSLRGAINLKGSDEVIVTASVIPVTISHARTPGDWLMMALGLLFVGLLVGATASYFATGHILPRKPTLEGSLVIDKPRNILPPITLEGMNELSIGQNTDILVDASGRLTLRAERHKKSVRVRVLADDGAVYLRRPGEKVAVAFGVETLQDGDYLEMAPYVLRYEA